MIYWLGRSEVVIIYPDQLLDSWETLSSSLAPHWMGSIWGIWIPQTLGIAPSQPLESWYGSFSPIAPLYYTTTGRACGCVGTGCINLIKTRSAKDLGFVAREAAWFFGDPKSETFRAKRWHSGVGKVSQILPKKIDSRHLISTCGFKQQASDFKQ